MVRDCQRPSDLFRQNVSRCFAAGGASWFKAVLRPWLCAVGSSVCGNLAWSSGNSLGQVVCNVISTYSRSSCSNFSIQYNYTCARRCNFPEQTCLVHPVCKTLWSMMKYVGSCISIAAAIMLSDGGIISEHVRFSDGRMHWILQDAIIFGELHQFYMVIARPILIFPTSLGMRLMQKKQSPARALHDSGKLRGIQDIQRRWLLFATLESLQLNYFKLPHWSHRHWIFNQRCQFPSLWLQDLQVERYLLGAGLSPSFIEASRVSFSFDVFLFICANKHWIGAAAVQHGAFWRCCLHGLCNRNASDGVPLAVSLVDMTPVNLEHEVPGRFDGNPTSACFCLGNAKIHQACHKIHNMSPVPVWKCSKVYEKLDMSRWNLLEFCLHRDFGEWLDCFGALTSSLLSWGASLWDVWCAEHYKWIIDHLHKRAKD